VEPLPFAGAYGMPPYGFYTTLDRTCRGGVPSPPAQRKRRAAGCRPYGFYERLDNDRRGELCSPAGVRRTPLRILLWLGGGCRGGPLCPPAFKPIPPSRLSPCHLPLQGRHPLRLFAYGENPPLPEGEARELFHPPRINKKIGGCGCNPRSHSV